jgi:hypothetical protein
MNRTPAIGIKYSGPRSLEWGAGFLRWRDLGLGCLGLLGIGKGNTYN